MQASIIEFNQHLTQPSYAMNRDRNTLKGFFTKGTIPSQENFADLIDSAINQNDDGISKLPNDPLRINASGPDGIVLNFYQNVADTKPAWALNLNLRDPANLKPPKLGWNLSDGKGISRLFVDASSGNVGIGTTNPLRKLQIGDGVDGISFDSGTSPNAGVWRFGDNTGWKLHFGRSSEASGGAANSSTQGLLMTIQDNGNVGIGTPSPTSILELDRNAPAAMGPALTLTNTGGNPGAAAAIDFNTFQPSSSGTYNPSTRIEALDGGGWANDIVFLSNKPGAANNGLVERMRITSAGVVVNGTIKSPMWSVSTPIPRKAGPLPISGSFESKGGTLIIFASGSGFRNDQGTMTVGVLVDNVLKGVLIRYTNEKGSHKTLVSFPLVVGGVGAGSHSIKLAFQDDGISDFNDYFGVTVLELPL
jgi:hypothetical protein